MRNGKLVFAEKEYFSTSYASRNGNPFVNPFSAFIWHGKYLNANRLLGK
jgi:hypothetical protein